MSKDVEDFMSSKNIPVDTFTSFYWLHGIYQLVTGTSSDGNLFELAALVDHHAENIKKASPKLYDWSKKQVDVLRQAARSHEALQELYADEYVQACIATMSEDVH